jgi:hypothetical protein
MRTVWLFSVLWLVATPALAQDDTARARELFQEGISLVDEGRWEDAVERFRAVLELRQSPAVEYNLAFALKNGGSVVEAAALLRGVANDPSAPPGLRRDAERMLRETEPLVAHLTIEISGDSEGTEVSIDDTPIPPDELLGEVPVDPGAHVVALFRGQEELDRERIDVAEGDTQRVSLEAPAAAPTPLDAAMTDSEAPPILEVDDGEDDDDSGGILTQWWFWAGIGVIAVGTVSAVVLASGGGEADPVRGNLDPGLFEIEVMP